MLYGTRRYLLRSDERESPMRHVLIAPILLAMATLAACTGSARQEDANKELVRAFTAAVNAADWEALDGLVAENLVRHSEATGGPPVTSRADFVRLQQRFQESFPDQQVTLEALVAEADRVAALARYRGTNTGPLAGAAPTGRPVDAPFLSIFRIDGGRIAEMWVEWDNLALYSQLGRSPPADGLTVVDRYLAAHRAGDVDALLKLHTGDAMFTVEGRPPFAGWEALRALYGWDAALGSELEFGDVTLDGDLLRIGTAVDGNRLLRELGIREVRYRAGLRIKLRGELIQGIYVPGFDEPSQQAVDEAFRPVIAWLGERDPQALAALLPDGRFRYDAASAARWLEVVAAWRGATAPEPPSN